LRIEESLRERGYMKARVRAVIAPASPELVPPVLVRYAVETGEPAILTGIAFEGRRFASRSFLERTAGLVVGQPAARQKVDEARSRLFATSIFSSVRSELRPVGDGKAEAVFTVEERPRFSVAYGLRWANSEGFAGVVDILDQNFFGRGITVGVRALYAQDDRSGRFYLASRDIFGSRLDLESFLEIRRRYEDGFVNDTTEATLQLSRPFSRKLTGRIYGKYRRTHLFEEIPLDPDFPLDLELSYPYAGSQLIWDTRDDPVFTNRGALATLDVQASGPFISSDFSFLRAFGQVNIYQPLLNWRSGPVTWAQSVRGGWAQAYLDQQLLPDLLFKAGGDSSVRGYPLESLGPNDALFGYLGGSRLVILNEELRFPILSRVSGVLFFDMGSIWNEGDAPRDFLVKSTGIGLRGNTPVGILRGDVAVPLDRREGEPSMKFYFGFGNIF
jgi:translocation and assembly module TamA